LNRLLFRVAHPRHCIHGFRIMKEIVRTFALAAGLTVLVHGQNPEGFKELKIGDPAPDFRLIGIDDKFMELADFKDAKVLAVAFTSNHCPTSNAAFPRFIKLYQDMKDRGFGVVAINPNHPDGLRPDELGYSKYGDSFEEMKGHARDQGFPFPYLYDGDTQTTAMAYGCLATPHIFVFDENRKLRYKGRIDDSRFPGEEHVKSPDLRNAVTALLVTGGALGGLPMSTTHVSSVAIMGVGASRGRGSLDSRTLRHIVLAWLITLPVAAALAAVSFAIIVRWS